MTHFIEVGPYGKDQIGTISVQSVQEKIFPFLGMFIILGN